MQRGSESYPSWSLRSRDGDCFGSRFEFKGLPMIEERAAEKGLQLTPENRIGRFGLPISRAMQRAPKPVASDPEA